MEYGLIGERLGHSYSREVHAALADYKYELVEIPKEELDRFMTERNFRAINVTIPYKEAVIPHLHYVDPMALEVGAVNTIVNRGGKLYGYNTDVYGMTEMIRAAGITLANKTVAILGTGGTSKTAHAVAASLSASKILTVSRSKRRGTITYDELYRDYSGCDVIINTTPVGMHPNTDPSPLDISRFEKLSGVVDVIYNPGRTALILDAMERGIPCATGLYMLVMQALMAVEIFLDKKIDERIATKVYRDILISKENTVLIGMPSSGKTTVGTALASLLGKEYVDTDEIIKSISGMTIPEIFEKRGEAAFRELECEAVRLASKKSGAVIATGGGAVLCKENVRELKKTGKLYFLDRPLEKLIPTSDRPLSSDISALRARFTERYPIYLKSADVIIDGSGTVKEVTDLILEKEK